jgi:serine/threonine protein kinase
MLVRKKSGVGAGKYFAMKILKKSFVEAKGQIENTKSEREILCEIRHPYIVRLRFAFQNDEKLYLVTDYYNGGTLFYHLRKSRAFSEERARFYAAELLLALNHLHSQSIIYRDLKLENVLLDHQGHVALTDFGLSKQDIDKAGGASTFCGTFEYIAPELFNRSKYGRAVDWWSFGVLLLVYIFYFIQSFVTVTGFLGLK